MSARLTSAVLLTAASSLLAVACNRLPGVPGAGGSKVDPNSCGNYAVTDAGRKLHAFLEATAQLEKTAVETEQVVKTSCVLMGNELRMSPADLSGATNDVCARVITTIQNNLKVGLKADAKLKVAYKPAVCRVDVEAAARAAAACEGKADADIGATCSGTCHGTCSGTCAGAAGTGGSGGQCDGQCQGTCKGECEGHANVDASAQCRANAEVHASVDVKCTEPELTVEADAAVVVDASKVDLTLGALRKGLPKILSVKARLEPLGSAVQTWAASAQEVAAAGGSLAQSFKDQAICISGQISAAVNAVAHIQASVHVSVEVSASASGTIGG